MQRFNVESQHHSSARCKFSATWSPGQQQKRETRVHLAGCLRKPRACRPAMHALASFLWLHLERCNSANVCSSGAVGACTWKASPTTYADGSRYIGDDGPSRLAAVCHAFECLSPRCASTAEPTCAHSSYTKRIVTYAVPAVPQRACTPADIMQMTAGASRLQSSSCRIKKWCICPRYDSLHVART